MGVASLVHMLVFLSSLITGVFGLFVFFFVCFVSFVLGGINKLF